MNRIYCHRALLPLALALATILGQACTCGSETSPNQPPVFTLVPRVVSGLFVDAATQLPVSDDVNVTVRDSGGALSTVVVDADGKPLTKLLARGGVATFRVAASAALPQTFVVVGRSQGYNSGSATVQVTSDDGAQFQIPLLDLSAPPAGVSTTVQSAGTASPTGAVSSDVIVATPAEATTGGQVRLEIPAQTVITTAEGTPLSGALTAQVANYNNTDKESLACFPGGLDQAPAPAGSSSPGVFVSGGFAAIQLTDAAGNLAARFSGPVSVQISVPADTVNPDTGAAVAPGATIPFWSYDEVTGVWSREGNVTLGSTAVSGNYSAVAQVSHLSYFNIDWLQSRCAAAPQVKITGNDQLLPLALETRSLGMGFFSTSQLSGIVSDVILGNAPRGVPVKLTALFEGLPVGSVSAQDLCAGPLTLPVVLPHADLASLSVSVVQTCVEDATRWSALPSATVIVMPKGGGSAAIRTTDAAGKATIPQLLAGSSYLVRLASLNGKLASTTAVPQKGDNPLTVSVPVVCDTSVTGTGGAGN